MGSRSWNGPSPPAAPQALPRRLRALRERSRALPGAPGRSRALPGASRRSPALPSAPGRSRAPAGAPGRSGLCGVRNALGACRAAWPVSSRGDMHPKQYACHAAAAKKNISHGPKTPERSRRAPRLPASPALHAKKNSRSHDEGSRVGGRLRAPRELLRQRLKPNTLMNPKP